MPLVWLAAAGMTGYYVEKTSENLVPVAIAGGPRLLISCIKNNYD